MKFMVKSCLLLTLVVFLGAGAGFWYYIEEFLPSLHQHSEAPVQGLPSDYVSRPEFSRSYQGSHPAFLSRPKETYSFPIGIGAFGPVEPLFAKVNPYPFWCGQDHSRTIYAEGDKERLRPYLQQPSIDNQSGIGIPIFAYSNEGERTATILGFSQDCRYPTVATYYYLSALDGRFHPLEDDVDPDTIAKTEIDGRYIDFIVRLETGTINRHIYAIAALKGELESLSEPSAQFWNRRLVYQFRGGVGIGKRQGNFKPKDVLRRRQKQLSQGYAVIYSTANQTSNHYNMWLAEDTALRVKKQFVALYGEPLYTVGIGGSGGAIQQYLLAQNNPNIIDAAIPLYSYPDMVTQTIYVLDCEPLEYFFDVTDAANPAWASWAGRSVVEGLSYSEDITNHFKAVTGLAALLQGAMPGKGFLEGGANECVNAWRGLTPLIHNPNFVHFKANFTDAVSQQVQWTHWDDLRAFYGTDSQGYANSTWDNVGVQYGLESLRNGKLDIDDFLTLNAHVGGWKGAENMQDERLWVLDGELYPVNLSFWSHQNINLAEVGSEEPAPRTAASLAAIQGAYRSGHVFLGYLDIPVIDVRHYLDPVLDMHHASASFMTRERLYRGQGHADNQVIWVAPESHEPQNEAFAVIDRWMMNILINPAAGVLGNKPLAARDKCFDAEGRVVAAGDGVWDGAWNKRTNGACMDYFPITQTSREIAGAPISGDIFKCQLQSVSDAIAGGEYGDLEMWPYLERLERVFPEGVCDYSLADMGRPVDLLEPPQASGGTAPPSQSSGERDIEDDAEAEKLPGASRIVLTQLTGNHGTAKTDSATNALIKQGEEALSDKR